MALNETLWTALLGAVTLVFLIGFWLLPGGVLALRRLALGELQVDVRLGYSPDTLYRILRLYGPDGIRSFRYMLLVDMVFPAVYGTLFFLLGDLAAVAHPGALWPGIVRVMAITAAGFDYLENMLLIFVLRHLPARQVGAARAAGICTSLKMLSFAVALGSLATTLLTCAVR